MTIEDIDRDFATEMIVIFGEERFYHCCKRTGGGISALALHMAINDYERSKSYHYLISIGINPYSKPTSFPIETHRESMCRIAYGFVRFYKEMGRKNHELTPSLNARMIFGEQNRWVQEYIKLLDSFPDWNLDEPPSGKV